METKTHDFADNDIKDHEKIDDVKSVEEGKSTEDNESVKESNIGFNRKSKKIKVRKVNKNVALRKNTNKIHKTISEEASNYQDGDIPWKDLQPKMEEKFGKLRSRNSLKNVWNSNKRRNDRLAKEVKRNEDKIEDITEKMNQLAFPTNEPGTYTKQEKLELRYLLNKDYENDKNDDSD
ncbi:hypothetical protein C1646_795754 [Rhizophagus diaphanus]|nr:hypothetical protein C1646_795754 [Rhizophagus diaphanus] [Rhizophagus sp. MUCL 43196]